MSIITDFLKLFKYDPETDGASTFNIKQCLNDNWDKIDAWASGIKTTIAGLVPGTRKVNGKELSADVTLTGEDIKTSASDETTISSQLSNTLKTSGNQTVVGLIASKYQSPETGFASVTGTSDSGFFEWYKSFETYLTERSQLILGKPVTGGMPSLQLSQTLDGQEFDIFDVAIATPPQKFTAPLSDGYSGSLVYLKTQENIVIVSFDVYKTDNSSINGVNLIGTLPEGFRGISGYCAALAMGVGGGSIVGAAQAWYNTDGSIQTLCPSGTYRIRGEIVFCTN